MGFADYPMPSTLRKSYIGSQDVLNYLESYASHFNVVEKVKFLHHVIRVRPVQDAKWEVCKRKFVFFPVDSKFGLKFEIYQVIVKDLPNDKVETHIYDAIFVCNGHNSAPLYPKPPYPGTQIFRGRRMHSHSYRRVEEFAGDFKAF